MSETINSYTSSELLHGFRIQPYRTKTFHHMMCDARHSETPNTASLQERDRERREKHLGGLPPMGGKNLNTRICDPQTVFLDTFLSDVVFYDE